MAQILTDQWFAGKLISIVSKPLQFCSDAIDANLHGHIHGYEIQSFVNDRPVVRVVK